MAGWGNTKINGCRGVIPIFPISALYTREPLWRVWTSLIKRRIPLLFYEDVTFIRANYFVAHLAKVVGLDEDTLRDYLSGGIQYYLHNTLNCYSELLRWNVSPLMFKFNSR